MPRSNLKRVAQGLLESAAMEPRRLEGFLSEHLRPAALPGVAVGPATFDNDPDEPAPPPKKPYQMAGSVAVVDVSGVLVAGDENDPWYGVKGYGAIAKELRAAVADPAVTAVVLRVNSPGGYSVGCPECADEILSLRGKGKPIVAFAETMAASAAYWLASAAEKLYATKASYVGSIGVWNAHVDVTKALENFGVKVTLIHAGARKVDGSPFRPMDDESRANMQGQCDAIWDMFAAAAGAHRGTTASAMKKTEARLFLGEEAVKEGLADGVKSFGALLAELNAGTAVAAYAVPAAAPAASTPAGGGPKEKQMTDEEIKALQAENERLRGAEAARQIAAADAQKKERDGVFATHAKRLSPATMVKMQAQLAKVEDPKAVDQILGEIPDQVHPTPTGSSAEPAKGDKTKLDPDLELVERAKALQKTKPHLSLGSACNEILANDPAFAHSVTEWREENPGPVVNLDAKFKKGAA